MEHVFPMVIEIGNKDVKIDVVFQIKTGWPDEAADVEDIKIRDDQGLTEMPLLWVPRHSDRIRIEDRCHDLAQELNEAAYNHIRQEMMDLSDEMEREG